jgi:hypothetical protein
MAMVTETAHVVRRGTLLFWLAASAAALTLFELVSGMILWLALPAGQGWRFSRAFTVWGLERHSWITLHNWAALLLTAVIVVHVALHWKWVARQTRAYLVSAVR